MKNIFFYDLLHYYIKYLGKAVIEDLDKIDYLEINVKLQGEENDWQNAQIFRTDNNNDCDNMCLKVHFK